MPEAQFKTIVEALRFRAATIAQDPVFIYLRDGQSDEETLSFKGLDQRAIQIAAAIRQRVPEGARVLINHSPGLEYVASFFGCLYAQVVAVPVYPPRFNTKLDRLVTIAQSAGAKLALTSSSIHENLRAVIDSTPQLGGLVWLETDRLDPQTNASFLADPSADGLAVIQYTSGSTSDPKGVMLSHGNLVANLKCIDENFELSNTTRSVSWLPPYHDMGLIGGLLPPLWKGFPMVLMSPYAFVQKPIRWLKAMSKYGGTISGGPNFAFDLCVQRIRDEQKEDIDLSRWKLAFCGAEPIRKSVLEAFAKKFESWGFKEEAFYPCYGLAEGTLIATGGKISEKPILTTLDPKQLEREGIVAPPEVGQEKRARAVVGCGVAVPNHTTLIVDPVHSTVLPEGQVGEIWLSGPSIAQGYWDKPEDTKAIFKAQLAHQASGSYHLRTGDLGFMLNRELYVTGRRKDLLIIRGRNFYPQDIEYTASKSHVALSSATAAAFSIFQEEEEKLVLLQEADRAIADDELDNLITAIRRQVFEDHGLTPYAVSILKRNSLPLTSSGKIQRYLCRKLFLEGQLKERKRFLED
jgi:acyl-CoA synthetase (AMP-forming)/AMP-acid ligase II